MVSGEIISLLLATLPSAARRLGDAESLRQYLNLIHQLTGMVPRGIRPMLAHLDELFGKLTLGGLRRWALWGALAHGRDFQAQIKYNKLDTADALAVLQKERRGTLLVDNQRKLNLNLRALWARDFFLRPTSGDYESREGYKPFIEQRVIHLPDAYDDYAGIAGRELYRAAAAHADADDFYRPVRRRTRRTPRHRRLPRTQTTLVAIPRKAARGELRGRSRGGAARARRVCHARRQLCRRRSVGARRRRRIPQRICCAPARQSAELGPRRHLLQRARRASFDTEPARAGVGGAPVSGRHPLHLVLRRGREARGRLHPREPAPGAQEGHRDEDGQRGRLRARG